MKNKIFKLFLVLMLIVSVFAVNVNPIHADGEKTIRIASNGQHSVFEYNGEDLYRTSSEIQDDNINSLEVSDESIDDETYAVIQLTKDIDLHCDPNDSVIKSTMPLKITSYNENGSDNKFTLKIHSSIKHGDLPQIYTGIECYSDLLIENVNIVFYPDFESKEYLEFESDEYKAIYVDNPSYDEYGSSDITIDNSDLVIYGTNGICNYTGNTTVINESNIRMFLKTPNSEKMIYENYSGSFIENYDGGLSIEEESYVFVRATVPEQSSSAEEVKYIAHPLILCTSFIGVDSDSSFIVQEPNYRFLNAVTTSLLDVEGKLSINGGIYGLMQYVERATPAFYAASITEGFHFTNAVFDITSLLIGICVRKNPPRNSISVSFTRNIEDTHQDSIKIVGDETDAEKLGLNKENISVIWLFNNEILSTNGISNIYDFLGSSVSSKTELPVYEEVVDINNINNYRAVVIRPRKTPTKVGCLNINSYGKRVTYYPDNLSDDDTDYFNNIFSVTFNEDTGFTVNVKKDFEFKLKEDELPKIFISCPSYGLHINGNNHTLSFTTNTEGSMTTALVKCVVLSSVEESSVKDLNIKLETKDSTTTANTTFLFADEGLTPRSTTVGEKIINNNFSLSNVNIYANSFSPLFRLSNLKTSITDSSIIYNYQTPLYVSEEFVQVDSIISTNKDVTIEDSKLEVHGNVAYDASSKAKVAISEISGNCNIKNCVVKGDGIDLGIGAFGLDIEDSNIDISSNRGGLIGFQSIHIKLSDGYHCNVTSKAATLDQEKILYPAIYSTITPVFDLPKDCVFKAVYPDGKEEIFNVDNMSKYASVSIVTNSSQKEEEEHHHSGGYIIPRTGIK